MRESTWHTYPARRSIEVSSKTKGVVLEGRKKGADESLTLLLETGALVAGSQCVSIVGRRATRSLIAPIQLDESLVLEEKGPPK